VIKYLFKNRVKLHYNIMCTIVISSMPHLSGFININEVMTRKCVHALSVKHCIYYQTQINKVTCTVSLMIFVTWLRQIYSFGIAIWNVSTQESV